MIVPTVKKEGLASAIMLSVDAIQSFLFKIDIDVEQLVHIDTNVLFNRVRAEVEKDRIIIEGWVWLVNFTKHQDTGSKEIKKGHRERK